MKTATNQPAFVTAPDKANHTSKDILAEHFCYCRAYVPCVFCLPWPQLLKPAEVWQLARRVAL
jgi:hypothetical protein